MKVRAKGRATRCAYCHGGEASGILVPCLSCGAAVHEDCRPCPTFGCCGSELDSVESLKADLDQFNAKRLEVAEAELRLIRKELSEPVGRLDERADAVMGLFLAAFGFALLFYLVAQ